MTAIDIYAVAAFVNARLEEAEVDATAAIGTAVFQKQTGRWVHRNVPDQYGSRLIVFAVAEGPEGEARTQVADLTAAWEGPERAVHIARHDPAHVLAQVAELRLIVSSMCSLHAASWQYGDARAEIEHLTVTTVIRLARSHADHPDYDPARWSQ